MKTMMMNYDDGKRLTFRTVCVISLFRLTV